MAIRGRWVGLYGLHFMARAAHLYQHPLPDPWQDAGRGEYSDVFIISHGQDPTDANDLMERFLNDHGVLDRFGTGRERPYRALAVGDLPAPS